MSGQSGAASLIVVMVLFFMVSLLAAYTNRNLIFEQKTSANQYRATQAFEAADAGMEWALAMLNGGVVTDQCTNGVAGNRSFAQRYLAIDISTGAISHPARSGNWPTCVFNGANWANCACPFDTALQTAPQAAPPAPRPAFRVWLAAPDPGAAPPIPSPAAPVTGLTGGPGSILVHTVGCTRLPDLPDSNDECLAYEPKPAFGDGVARTEASVILRSALSVPPAAAVTARLDLFPSLGDAKLIVSNPSARSGGITVNVGNDVANSTQVVADGPPGAPGGAMTIVTGDPVLQELLNVAPAAGSLTARERMFVSVFGMKRQTYRQQPGLRVCPTDPDPCTDVEIADLLARNPNRIIWVDGDVTLNASIGSPDAPVLLVINNGRLRMTAGLTITGFIYLSGDPATDIADITLPDARTYVIGAIVAEGSLRTTYASGAPAATHELKVTHDLAALDRLRWTYGSWVRTGAAWRDFRVP